MGRKCKGSSYIQYALIIILAGLVVIPAFNALGIKINEIFTGYSKDYTQMNKTITENIASSTPITTDYKAGDLNGTPTAPVQKCSGSVCTIDYGTYILNGIPEDFTEFIRTNGSSGGTDAVLDLMEQIAQQLEDSGNAAGADKYRDLANLGHYIAQVQNKTESVAGNSEINAGDNSIISDSIRTLAQGEMVATPSNVLSIMPALESSKSVYDINNNDFIEIGMARNLKLNDPDTYNSKVETDVAYKFVDIYDQIINDPAIDDSLKSITQELYYKIGDMNKQFLMNTCSAFTGWSEGTYFTNYNPLTGEPEPQHIVLTTRETITNPQYSNMSNLNSALICVAGKNLDEANACH